MPAEAYTPDEEARLTRLIALAVHAAAIVNAIHVGTGDKYLSALQALTTLEAQYRSFYPEGPRDGLVDIREAALLVGMNLEVIEIPVVQPSKYGAH